jgi:hypothetical protein
MSDPNKLQEAGKKARRLLVTNAIQSMAYVADGTVMKRDLAAEFGLTERVAESLLAANYVDLAGAINKLL